MPTLVSDGIGGDDQAVMHQSSSNCFCVLVVIGVYFFTDSSSIQSCIYDGDFIFIYLNMILGDRVISEVFVFTY